MGRGEGVVVLEPLPADSRKRCTKNFHLSAMFSLVERILLQLNAKHNQTEWIVSALENTMRLA